MHKLFTNGYTTPDCVVSASIEETMLCASFETPEITEIEGGFEWE